MPPASGQCAQLYLKLPGAKPLSALALSHRPGGRVLLSSEPWLAQLPPPPPVVLGPSLSVPEWPGPSWEQHQAVSLLAQLPPPVGGLAGGTGPHSPGSDQDAWPVTPCVWGREGAGHLALCWAQHRLSVRAGPFQVQTRGLVPYEPPEETPRPALLGSLPPGEEAQTGSGRRCSSVAGCSLPAPSHVRSSARHRGKAVLLCSTLAGGAPVPRAARAPGRETAVSLRRARA